jgi:hypothetical protein
MDKLSLQVMTNWLQSCGKASNARGIVFAELRQSAEYLPSACGDFDTESRSGRISIWANGLIDLEVLSLESGKHVYFEHCEIEDLGDPELTKAVNRFLEAMVGA